MGTGGDFVEALGGPSPQSTRPYGRLLGRSPLHSARRPLVPVGPGSGALEPLGQQRHPGPVHRAIKAGKEHEARVWPPLIGSRSSPVPSVRQLSLGHIPGLCAGAGWVWTPRAVCVSVAGHQVVGAGPLPKARVTMGLAGLAWLSTQVCARCSLIPCLVCFFVVVHPPLHWGLRNLHGCHGSPT